MRLIVTICLILVLQLSAANLRAQSKIKPDLIVQTGHSKAVNAVALSPDGKLMASASDDGTFKIWDAARGRELRSFSAPLDSFTSVAFSPDGKLLAVGSINKGCQIINVETGIKLDRFKSENLSGESVAFSPDGKLFACAGSSGSQPPDGDVEIWEIATGKISRLAKSNADKILDIAFSPDGQTIVTGSRDHTVRLWDVKTGAELQSFTGFSETVETVAFSPDGLTIAGGDWGGKVKLWNAQTGGERRTFDEEKNCNAAEIKSIAFSPDGKFLAAGCSDFVFLWNAATGEKIYQVKDEGIITNLVFTADGASVLSGGYDTIKVRNAATGKELKRFKRNANSVGTVAFTADGKRLANASNLNDAGNNFVRLWSADNGSEVRRFDTPSVAVAAALSPDGKILAGSGPGESVFLWDAQSGRQLHRINFKEEVNFDYINFLTFSPDGKILAGGGKRNVRLWDVASGSELRVLHGHGETVDQIAFSPNGKVLATGDGIDDFIKLWDVATGRELMTLKGYEARVDSFAFSPDGKFIAVQNLSEISINDLAAGKKVRAIETLGDGNYESLAFSPNGKILAGGDTYDGHITFWDFQTGKEIRKLVGHKSDVNSIAFGAGGKVLASSSEDSTIKLWNTETGAEMASLIALGESDWLVVTPDGLFDGSPNAWKELLWRFNNNTFNTVPVEAFFKEFYYPGLLGEVLQGSPPRPPERNLAQTDVRAPGVNIVAVNRQDVRDRTKILTFSQPTVKVTIGIAENPNKPLSPKFAQTGGARDLRLFRNGSLVKIWNKSVFDLTEKDGCRQLPPTKELSVRRVLCEAEIQITAGDNNFSAYVFNDDNVKSLDSETTVRGADSLQRRGTLYVLAVGVNQYANPNFNLRYAVADVEAVAEVLTSQQIALNNYAETKIVELTDKNATKANILAALNLFGEDQAILPENSPADLRKIKKLTPEDALVIYYAGHGTASKDRFYLIPHDGFPATSEGEKYYEELYANSVSDENLATLLESADAGKILMVIDACNSGQALESEEKRRGPMNSKGLAQLAFEKGMSILTAAQSFQAALEVSRSSSGRKIEHGLLTYSLLEGLTDAKADQNADQKITEREWLNFAVGKVPQMQIEAMQKRDAEIKNDPQGKRSGVVFINGGNSKLPPEQRGLQTPRVFYRRDAEAKPLVVAAQ